MCSVCERQEDNDVPAGNVGGPGDVAQLVERHHGMVEVVGSSPIISTYIGHSPPLLGSLLRAWRLIGFTLGGLVAAEGSFAITKANPSFADGTPKLRFVFQIEMASRDSALLEAIRDFLGKGSIHHRRGRKLHWQPTTVLTIASREAHHAATIPFADRHLLPCAKRRQFELWRDSLISYEALTHQYRKRGRSVCRIGGCDKLVRGRMLCRSHYYSATGY